MRHNQEIEKQSFGSSIRKPVLALSIIVLLISACKKERVESEKKKASYSKPTAFYNKNKQQEQEFDVDSTGSGIIRGKEGTILSGDGSIFMYPNKQSITYPFKLKLIEVYGAKDMILSNLPSVAGTTLLETGGEISIKAFKNNQELLLKPGKKYTMALDTNPNLLSGMKVFYGFVANNIQDWTGTVSTLDPTINPDTLSSIQNLPLFYLENIARMGWVNCARNLSASGSSTTISFTASGANPQAIDIFLVSKNSVMQVYNLQSYPLPIGTPVTVIAIAMDQNNALVYDKQSITVSSGLQVTLNPVTTTEASLLTILGSL